MQPGITFLDPASAGYARRKICRNSLAPPNGDFVWVQLNRDNYVDSRRLVGGPPGWKSEALEAAARCQRAGLDCCAFRGCTLERFWSLNDRWIDLLVPGDVVEDAVEALREAEMDGTTERLAVLTERLAVPLDTWLAPGEHVFHRGRHYTGRSSHFLRTLRSYAKSRQLRLEGRAQEDSVRVEVRPERLKELQARLQRQRKNPSRGRRCFLCDFEYLPSLAENRREHRKRCRAHQAALWPCASPGLARLPRVGNGLIPVSGGSPAWLRERFFLWSRLLCRECGYETVCNVAEPTVTGLLLADEHGTMRAVAAVRPDGWQGEMPGRCVLAWVWVPPMTRRQGALAELWGRIEGHFGVLEVEGPCSPSMWAFLEARGLLERVVERRKVHESGQPPEVAAAWTKRGPSGRSD